jgi:hypothetical protein
MKKAVKHHESTVEKEKALAHSIAIQAVNTMGLK